MGAVLLVERVILRPTTTVSIARWNGVPEMFVLEDTVRPPGEKIPGETAIPYGEYPLVYTPSQRFKRDMPRLLDVPMFNGILIHAGNSNVDTEGCLLTGNTYAFDSPDYVSASKVAWDRWVPKLLAALKVGTVTCKVVLDQHEGER